MISITGGTILPFTGNAVKIAKVKYATDQLVLSDEVGVELMEVPKYAEFYFYTASGGSPTALGIDIVNQYHGIVLAAAATPLVDGFTYKAGAVGIIDAVADNGAGTILVTTAAPHGLAVGDYICQTGFDTRTTYRGKYVVLTTPSTVTYTVTRAFETSTDVGHFQRAFSFRVNSGANGLYHVNFNLSAQAVTNTTQFRFELNKNTGDLDNIAIQHNYVTNTLAATMAGSGIISVAVNDVIYASVKNLTDATDFQVWLMNLNLTRIAVI